MSVMLSFIQFKTLQFQLFLFPFFFLTSPPRRGKSGAFVTTGDGLFMTGLVSTQPTCQSAHFERRFSSAGFQLSALHFTSTTVLKTPAVYSLAPGDDIDVIFPSICQIRVDCP